MPIVQQTQWYRVRMDCGHFEDRRMRPETAGTPWLGPDTICAGKVTPGTLCVRCDPSREALGATMSANQCETHAWVPTASDYSDAMGYHCDDCGASKPREG